MCKEYGTTEPRSGPHTELHQHCDELRIPRAQAHSTYESRSRSLSDRTSAHACQPSRLRDAWVVGERSTSCTELYRRLCSQVLALQHGPTLSMDAVSISLRTHAPPHTRRPRHSRFIRRSPRLRSPRLVHHDTLSTSCSTPRATHSSAAWTRQRSCSSRRVPPRTALGGCNFMCTDLCFAKSIFASGGHN